MCKLFCAIHIPYLPRVWNRRNLHLIGQETVYHTAFRIELKIDICLANSKACYVTGNTKLQCNKTLQMGPEEECIELCYYSVCVDSTGQVSTCPCPYTCPLSSLFPTPRVLMLTDPLGTTHTEFFTAASYLMSGLISLAFRKL